MYQRLQHFSGPFKKGLILGAIASLAVYGCIRLLFFGYDFTLVEEVTNIFKIVLTGGLLTGCSVISFLLVESTIIYGRSKKFSFAPASIGRLGTAIAVIGAFGYLVKSMM